MSAGKCSERTAITADAAQQLLLASGPQVMQGLVGALLAPSPLTRVFKVTSVLESLASTRLQPDVHSGRTAELVLQWLSFSLEQLPAGRVPYD